MRFVPVKFDMTNVAIGQFHEGTALQLSPTAMAIDFLQVCQVADMRANRNYFNELNIVNDFEFHVICFAFLNVGVQYPNLTSISLILR